MCIINYLDEVGVSNTNPSCYKVENLAEKKVDGRKGKHKLSPYVSTRNIWLRQLKAVSKNLVKYFI